MHTRRLAALSLMAACAVALTAAVAAAPAAHAAPPDPGTYAIVCGVMERGDTKAQALAACTKQVRGDRAFNQRDCSCAKHADIVTFTSRTRPAFYVAGYAWKGSTPAKATAACRSEERQYKHRTKTDRATDWGCEKVTEIYGPYKRRAIPSLDYDDPKVYRYLTADGSWVDTDGEGPCFVAGTMVATPAGDKAIETFAPGDTVLSWSLEDARLVPARVLRVKPRIANDVLEIRTADNRTLHVTPNHPLRSPSRAGWVEAGELRVGDTLAVLDGATLREVAITATTAGAPTSTSSDTVVYDLTVTPTHSYFAGGIWAHNY